MSDYTHGEYETSGSQKRYYTPTTEEVRMYYKHPEGSKIAWRVTPVEFDRWLAEVRADAWQDGAYHIAGKDNELVHVADTENPYRQGENK